MDAGKEMTNLKETILINCFYLSSCPRNTLSYPVLNYVVRPQSTFPTRPTASKPYIARSDCAYMTEQCCSMAYALTVLPAFSQ
jgi:hypothetical protein